MLMEKISFPSAGLFARNLRDSGYGAHPVLRLERSAGFSHPRNPKISKVSFGPDCSGGKKFSPGQNLPAGGGVGPSERDRKNPASRPVERGRLKPFSNINPHLPNDLLISYPTLHLEYMPLVFLLSSNRRPSARPRREILLGWEN